MADRSKKHIVYLTIDEIMGLSVIAETLLKTDGKLGRLSEIPISEQFKADLASANEKLSKKIEEIGK